MPLLKGSISLKNLGYLDIFFMEKCKMLLKKKVLVEVSFFFFHNELVLHCIFFLVTSFAPLQWTENVKKSWPKLTRKRWMLQLPSPSEKLRHSCLNSTDLRSFYLTRYLLCSLCEWFISHNIVIHTVIHMHGNTHPHTHAHTVYAREPFHHILTELCELVMFYQMWTTKCMIQRLWAYTGHVQVKGVGIDFIILDIIRLIETDLIILAVKPIDQTFWYVC